MGPKKDVIDIVSELGGIKTPEAAREVLKAKMDQANQAKLSQINNPEILMKMANAVVMCEPDAVFIASGSEEDRQFVRDLSLEKGEESKLFMEGHTIHYDLKEEQGRIIDRTFYIHNEGEEVNSLALKKDRAEALEDIRDKMTGIMKGKLMMVGFYMRGPVCAAAANPAVEISSGELFQANSDLNVEQDDGMQKE